MEWAKRNLEEKTKNEKEKSELDRERTKQIKEEIELNDRIKLLKKREHEEL